MRSNEFLKCFLAMMPDAEMLALPVYYADDTGCPQPLKGVTVKPIDPGEGEFDSGDCIMLYDRRSRRGAATGPIKLGDMWEQILAFRTPNMQVVLGLFADTGSYDAYNILDVHVLQAIDTGEKIVCVTPIHYEFE